MGRSRNHASDGHHQSEEVPHDRYRKRRIVLLDKLLFQPVARRGPVVHQLSDPEQQVSADKVNPGFHQVIQRHFPNLPLLRLPKPDLLRPDRSRTLWEKDRCLFAIVCCRRL